MKLITLIKYNLKNFFYSKTAFLGALILPPLAIILAVFISTSLFVNHNFIEPVNLVLVDKEQSFYTNFFIQNILETPSLQENIDILLTSETQGLRLLEENKAAGMVIIPENFTSDMQESVFQPILVIGNPNKALQAAIIKEGMESATNLISAAQSAVFTVTHYASKEELSPSDFDLVFQKAAMSFSLKALGRGQIFSQTIKTPWMDLAPVYFYFSSILLVFISLSGLQGMYLYMKERQDKITTRIRTSGTPWYKIILGKWLSLTCFLFIQAGLILTICVFIDLLKIKINLTLGLFMILTISSCISALSLLVASFSKNDYLGALTIFCMTILGVFLGGGIIPYSYMPNFVEQVGKLTFNYWAIQGLIYSLFSSNSRILWQSGALIGLLTLLCLSTLYLRVVWKETNT